MALWNIRNKCGVKFDRADDILETFRGRVKYTMRKTVRLGPFVGWRPCSWSTVSWVVLARPGLKCNSKVLGKMVG